MTHTHTKMHFCLLAISVIGVVSQGPGDVCIGQCRSLHAAGCCKYDGATTECLWSPGGHVNGGSSISTASASANCHTKDCDGWNWGEDCSGKLEPVPGPSPSPPSPPSPPTHWKMVWSDEFDACPHGRPDPSNWGYEHGYVRNHEQQWYQQDNAACVNGSLVITARREHPSEKPTYEYTSSSLKSQGKREFKFGRFEMRGKIPIESGSWPAWWTLGANTGMGWPSSGEIDIMEYYRGNVLANFDYGNSKGKSVWNSHRTPVDKAWADKFHVWAMEWDATQIKLFLDGKVVNTEKVSAADGTGHSNPWREFSQYMILNLAIGGQNGGDPAKTKFPLKYYVDYVRVYEKASEAAEVLV